MNAPLPQLSYYWGDLVVVLNAHLDEVSFSARVAVAEARVDLGLLLLEGDFNHFVQNSCLFSKEVI